MNLVGHSYFSLRLLRCATDNKTDAAIQYLCVVLFTAGQLPPTTTRGTYTPCRSIQLAIYPSLYDNKHWRQWLNEWMATKCYDEAAIAALACRHRAFRYLAMQQQPPKFIWLTNPTTSVHAATDATSQWPHTKYYAREDAGLFSPPTRLIIAHHSTTTPPPPPTRCIFYYYSLFFYYAPTTTVTVNFHSQEPRSLSLELWRGPIKSWRGQEMISKVHLTRKIFTHESVSSSPTHYHTQSSSVVNEWTTVDWLCLDIISDTILWVTTINYCRQ